MKLSCHRYQLQSPTPIGALSRGSVRHGALLRVISEAGEIGYADVHPWPELGDLPLAEQLSMLTQGETTELTRASLAFAALDAKARADERSLWDGLTMPASHFLLTGSGKDEMLQVEQAIAEGFKHFKIKRGKGFASETKSLLKLGAFLKSLSVAGGGPPRLRLDYNQTMTPALFGDQFETLAELRPFLDFIEDPCPFDAAIWAEQSARMQLTLAVDRAASSPDASAFAGVIIHKPARSGPILPLRVPEQRIVVTSYLDHPLGQLCAAWVAAHMASAERVETHGLVSHRVYAKTKYSDRLGWSGPILQVPEGLGFGLDAELAGTDWSSLA